MVEYEEESQPKEVGLPKLFGTEEEVSQAELVRFNVLTKNMEIINSASGEFKSFARNRLKNLCHEKDAHFWVSKRDRILTSYEDVLRLFQEEVMLTMARN